MDALSPDDRLTMEVAQSVREDFLQQNAFEEGDTYTSLPKQYALISLILDFYDKASAALRRGADVQKIADLPVREKIGRAKSRGRQEIQEDLRRHRGGTRRGARRPVRSTG